jgi:hypothetical protein
MTNMQRFLIGGAGGLAPLAMLLATVDFARVFEQPTLFVVLGYIFRAALFFGIAGFVAYLQNDEQKPFKTFQLGLGVPAMIASYIATGPTLPPAAPTAPPAMVMVVYAAEIGPQAGNGVKQFTLPPTGAVGQFVEGLTGGRSPNVWFVIVSAYASLNDAQAAAQKINNGKPGFHADVYAPYQDSTSYSVVIGANLTQDQAKALQQKAVSAGLGASTYYKTFSSLPRA